MGKKTYKLTFTLAPIWDNKIAYFYVDDDEYWRWWHDSGGLRKFRATTHEIRLKMAQRDRKIGEK